MIAVELAWKAVVGAIAAFCPRRSERDCLQRHVRAYGDARAEEARHAVAVERMVDGFDFDPRRSA